MITTYYVHMCNKLVINTISFLKLCQTEHNLTYTEIHEQMNKLTNSNEQSPLEKLTGSQVVKKFPTFMEPEGSLLHSQEPTTYAEPDQSSPCPPIPLPEYPT
jgi:hypothetical protein